MRRHRVLHPVATAYIAVAMVVLLFSASALALNPATRSHRARDTIPSPSSSSLLYGITCLGGSTCWAVGYYTNSSNAQLNEVLRWNGHTWSQAVVPQPGGTGSGGVNYLHAISCPAASRCWAVGEHANGAGAQLNEVLRWNGSKWSRATPPQPGGKSSGAINNLDAVACSSKSNCWAVGVFTGKTGGFENQTLHWNGKKWAHVKAPNPGGTSSAAFNLLQGLSCTAKSDCWAVGDFETSAYFNQALHWNGRRWARTKVPQPGGAFGSNLTALSCLSARSCRAVGGFNTSGGAALNQALHWNGRKWSHGKTPQPGGKALNDQSGLSGIGCNSTRNCWAVGSFETALGPGYNEALHWNARKWSLSPTPDPGGTETGDSDQLEAVSCPSASDCWAVGYYSNSSGMFNLALHWNGHKWLVH